MLERKVIQNHKVWSFHPREKNFSLVRSKFCAPFFLSAKSQSIWIPSQTKSSFKDFPDAFHHELGPLIAAAFQILSIFFLGLVIGLNKIDAWIHNQLVFYGFFDTAFNQLNFFLTRPFLLLCEVFRVGYFKFVSQQFHHEIHPESWKFDVNVKFHFLLIE